MTEVENRVVRVDECYPHDDNYNRHSVDQIAYLRDSLHEFDQVRSIAVQETDDGYVIVAGEGLWTAARQEGLAKLRADVIPADWSEEKVLAYLAVDNVSAKMSDPDQESFEAVVARIHAAGQRELARLSAGGEKELARIVALHEGARPKAKLPDRPMVTGADVPDAIWPTDNDFGIPLLLESGQADAIDLPVDLWGSRKGGRKRTMRGTWVFYTDDYRFTGLWSDPSPVVNTQCVNVAEVNYSTSDLMPLAVGIYRTYQKRWMARWWQSQGIRVFVDLAVADPFSEVNLLGVPDGWKAYCVRGYNENVEQIGERYEVACSKAGTSDVVFFVYGGGRDVERLCRKLGLVWVPEQRDEVGGRRMYVPTGSELIAGGGNGQGES